MHFKFGESSFLFTFLIRLFQGRISIDWTSTERKPGSLCSQKVGVNHVWTAATSVFSCCSLPTFFLFLYLITSFSSPKPDNSSKSLINKSLCNNNHRLKLGEIVRWGPVFFTISQLISQVISFTLHAAFQLIPPHRMPPLFPSVTLVNLHFKTLFTFHS